MPKINETLLELEGFQCATSLDLNMGYYHIRISKNENNLCTIILLWGKHSYKCLPMEVANSPDILQHEMNDLIHGFEFIREYINNLLILTKGDWTNYVQKLELILNKLKEKDLNIISKIYSSEKLKWNI